MLRNNADDLMQAARSRRCYLESWRHCHPPSRAVPLQQVTSAALGPKDLWSLALCKHLCNTFATPLVRVTGRQTGNLRSISVSSDHWRPDVADMIHVLHQDLCLQQHAQLDFCNISSQHHLVGMLRPKQLGNFSRNCIIWK